MESTTLVPVDVYLRTAYRPDCDYIDGEVLERNMGEIPHGRLQGFFRDLFVRYEALWRLEAIPEIRVQVAPNRFRVPDLAIIPYGSPDLMIVRSAPMLCIEIFSSDDRMSRMQQRVADYRAMGVPVVWVVDPWRRTAYYGEVDGKLITEPDALVVPGTAVTVRVEEIFAELDRRQQSVGA